MPRLFVAVYPLEHVEKLVEIQEKISPYVSAKFVEKENLHITLSFIGDVPEGEEKIIEEKLSMLLSNWKAMVVKLDGLKFIPNEKFVRVIAIDVISESLLKLAMAIGKLVGGDTKPPHITLCRVKNVIDKQKLLDLKKEIKLEEEIKVDKISLVKSTLSRTGPTYQILKQFSIEG